MNKKRYGSDAYKTRGRNSGKGVKWALLATVIFILCLFVLAFVLGSFRFMMPRLMGVSGFPFGSRTYLLIVQDNNVLRPAGGRILSYGELRFKNGIYRGMTSHDVQGDINEREKREAPVIVGTLLTADEDEYGFRDANTDPDFAKSTQEILAFYSQNNPETRVDGVIAIDFHYLELWLERFGKIYVEGVLLESHNLFETVSAQANPSVFTGKAVEILLKKSLMPWRLRGNLNLLARGFIEKHALASFTRKGLNKAFAKRQWTGALPKSDSGDAFGLSEANYGGAFSNRYITRDVQYELDISDRKDLLGNPLVIGTVSVRLSHEGVLNPPLSDVYTGILRTMIPLGSKILQGSDISEKREDMQVIGEIVNLSPGESLTYEYTFELPEYVWMSGVYNLHLHKQPGTYADNYRVIVRAPIGTEILSPYFQVTENLAIFETKLLNDVNLFFEISKDNEGPKLLAARAIDGNELELEFNEAVKDPDPSKISVFQSNAINSQSGAEAGAEVGAQIRVLSATATGKIIRINLEDISELSAGKFQIQSSGISDLEGNYGPNLNLTWERKSQNVQENEQ